MSRLSNWSMLVSKRWRWFWWKIFCTISTQVTWISVSKWILMAKEKILSRSCPERGLRGKTSNCIFYLLENLAGKYCFKLDGLELSKVRNVRNKNDIVCICKTKGDETKCSPNIFSRHPPFKENSIFSNC